MDWISRLTESWREAQAEGDAARQAYQDTDDDLGPVHGKVWEFFHPRQAAAELATAEQEYYRKQDMQIEEDIAEHKADADYWDWREDYPHKGNPPDSRELDREVERFSQQYPEVSWLATEQKKFEAEAYERGPNMSYPEYEGPGFTEPPMDSEIWHHDHTGWTFSEWADERDYAPELIEDINHEFPPDQREVDYARRRDEQYEADEPDPDPEQLGLLRIIPMEKAADSAREYPRQREVRGEPDPYNPLHFPSYPYWPQGVEAAE
jgi:hypothetical protein